MKRKLSKETSLVLITTLFSILSAFACVEHNNLKPEAVVKQFWEYCLKGKFNKAGDLTCRNRECVYPSVNGEENDSVTYSSVEVSAVDKNGNKIMGSDDSTDRDNAKNRLKTFYLADQIFERK